MQVAQDFCQTEPGEAEAGLRIAMHVWLLYYWNAGHVSEGRYRLGQALARAGEPTVWRAQGLLLAGLLATLSGDRGSALPLLAEGTSLARQLNDPRHAGVRRLLVAGNVCWYAGDLPQAIAHFEGGLAALPTAAVHVRLRVILLLILAAAAGVAGDEERVVACRRELAALTEAGGEFAPPLVLRVLAVGAGSWRPGAGATSDRAADLVQQSLRLGERLNHRMGAAYCMEALAWIAASGRQYERAAVLLGAAAAAASLLRSLGMTLDSNQPMAGYQRDCERAGPPGPGRAGVPGRLPPRPAAARRRRPRLRPAAAAGQAAQTAVGADRTRRAGTDRTRTAPRR